MESSAPGPLESIRALLNTWSIPNDTREAVDELPGLIADEDAWTMRVPDLRFPRGAAERRALSVLRAAIRAAISGNGSHALDQLVAAQRWKCSLDTGDGTVRWISVPASAVGDALAIVVDAVVADTWPRLRACPDCQWVFYDTSRNARRTWCSMTASDGARGCGSIAKTRAYRQRQTSR